jgi:site-specific recombinase XerD
LDALLRATSFTSFWLELAFVARASAATLMVRNGATIKQVADILRHQSIATTQIYVKLDEPSLKGVALAWPGGDL